MLPSTPTLASLLSVALSLSSLCMSFSMPRGRVVVYGLELPIQLVRGIVNVLDRPDLPPIVSRNRPVTFTGV